MNYSYFLVRRQFCLLTFLVLIISCSNNKSNSQENIVGHIEPSISFQDSLEFNVHVKKGGYVGFNFYDDSFNNFFIEFLNESSNDSTIVKKTSKIHDTQVIMYGFLDRSQDTSKVVYQHFLIGEDANILSFEVLDNLFQRANENKDFFEVSNLYEGYREIRWAIRRYERFNTLEGKRNDLINELDSLSKVFNIKYKNNHNLSGMRKEYYLTLNDYQYFDKLQLLDPLDRRPDEFLINLKRPINGELLRSLFYNHIKNRINELEFSKLNFERYSPDYFKYFTLGIYTFLKEDVNKVNNEFEEARKWLRETDWYKKNKALVDNEITPIDNETFKNLLNKLVLKDFSLKKTSISEIISDYKSDYYLVDFWATWCKPCIEGVKVMKEKGIPSNVSVISLSLDRPNKHNKWVEMTTRLNQEISYLLNEDQDLKKFVNFMELQSIPRYIIIDEEMNLINEAFLAPHEPDFKKRLEGLK